MNKQKSFTKKGPGCIPATGDGSRTAKQRSAGRYAAGLTVWRTGKPSKGRI